jgi:hypothetical protein
MGDVYEGPSWYFQCATLGDAQSYLQASEILIRKESPKVIVPTYFLMSHALELILKSYLIARGGFDDAALRGLNHDIGRALEEAMALGLHLDDDRAITMVRILSDFHKAFLFRYPTITRDDGSLVVRGNLVQPSEVLEIIATISQQVHGPVLSARLDAATQGEYPIETWHMGGTD